MAAVTLPVTRMLDDVAAGRLPEPDGAVDVYPQPDGLSAPLQAFTAHHVVAADSNPDWVQAAFAGQLTKGAHIVGVAMVVEEIALGATPISLS